MNKTALLLIGLMYTSMVFGQIPSAEVQIKTALMAAPEAMRAGAMVYGYNPQGELEVLRQGTNELVCLADNPNQDGLNVACYHKDLEPFMARGRELRAQGKSPKEIFDIREEEVKAGKLTMPKQATNLQIYFAPADAYNPQNGEVTGGNFRYVVYIPWATAETTGLPLKPEAPGMPWLMDPGTHSAHIMITPPIKN